MCGKALACDFPQIKAVSHSLSHSLTLKAKIHSQKHTHKDTHIQGQYTHCARTLKDRQSSGSIEMYWTGYRDTAPINDYAKHQQSLVCKTTIFFILAQDGGLSVLAVVFAVALCMHESAYFILLFKGVCHRQAFAILYDKRWSAGQAVTLTIQVLLLGRHHLVCGGFADARRHFRARELVLRSGNAIRQSLPRHFLPVASTTSRITGQHKLD